MNKSLSLEKESRKIISFILCKVYSTFLSSFLCTHKIKWEITIHDFQKSHMKKAERGDNNVNERFSLLKRAVIVIIFIVIHRK